jgi:hypothetical protein
MPVIHPKSILDKWEHTETLHNVRLSVITAVRQGLKRIRCVHNSCSVTIVDREYFHTTLHNISNDVVQHFLTRSVAICSAISVGE